MTHTALASTATPRAAVPALGISLVLGSAVLFALNGTVAKLIMSAGLDPVRLTVLRSTCAALGLLGLTAVRPPGLARLRPAPRELPVLVGFGLTGFFLVPMLYFEAIRRLPVSVALLLEYTAPLVVALWARFGQHQRVRPRLWLGLALSLAGLATVVRVWTLAGGTGRLDPVGIAAGLGAAGLLGFYYVLGARGVARRDTVSLTCWAFAVSALAGAVVRPWWDFPWPVLAGHGQGVPVGLLLAYLVLGGSMASFLLIAAAMRHLPPTSVGIVGMVEPVIATVVAWLVLGERVGPVQLAGGALILAGVTLAETARTAAGPAGGATKTTAPVGARIAAPQNGTMHPNVTAVQDALDACDAHDGSGARSLIRTLPDAVLTAVAAAAALEVQVGQIANSLIFDADGQPLLVLTSGAHRVDTARVAALLGLVSLRRATPEFVRTHTGQPIGGVAPLGHPKPLRTLVDEDLAGYPEIWAAGGIPHAVFPTTYPELVRITAGTPASVA